jgi:hypothetical protein
VVQTGIKIIKIIYNNRGKQSEDQYGGDPSEDVGPPFPTAHLSWERAANSFSSVMELLKVQNWNASDFATQL